MNTVQQIHDGPLVQVLLDRPEKSNAFNELMIEELIQTFSDIEKNPETKVILLSSTGKNFCAGADLEWMKRMAGFSEQENYADAMQLATLFQTIYNATKPIVCVVDGAAYGGALGLIACSDIVLATKRSRFCFSEVKLGLSPSTIAPYVLQKIGAPHASRYFLTAEVFDPNIALNMSLIQQVSTQDTIEQDADEIISHLLQNGPAAMAKTKQLIREINPIDDALIENTSKMIAELRVGVEAQQGIKAFFDKTQPTWAN